MYVLLIVGVLFLALFLYVEHRVDNPLLPPETLRGDAGALLGCIAAGWSCFGIWIYYVHRFGFEIEHRTMLNMTARLCFIASAAYTLVYFVRIFSPC